MSFRELTKFNQAMLAKQVWRLTNSLFYRVFKTKYFLNGSIFETKEKSGSYAWKSILRARKVIAMGEKWQVGDGLSIRIYKDSWLPREGSGRTVSPPKFMYSESKVSQLINPDTNWWNTSLIDKNFYPFEAQKIKSLPLPSFSQVDFLFWPYTNSRLYVVKSRYQLLCKECGSESASASNGAASKHFWTNLWKMTVPNKVKTFMWRACNDSLPTMKQLVQKTIISSSICASCLYTPEDTLHALWGCANLNLKKLVYTNQQLVDTPFCNLHLTSHGG